MTSIFVCGFSFWEKKAFEASTKGEKLFCILQNLAPMRFVNLNSLFLTRAFALFTRVGPQTTITFILCEQLRGLVGLKALWTAKNAFSPGILGAYSSGEIGIHAWTSVNIQFIWGLWEKSLFCRPEIGNCLVIRLLFI